MTPPVDVMIRLKETVPEGVAQRYAAALRLLGARLDPDWLRKRSFERLAFQLISVGEGWRLHDWGVDAQHFMLNKRWHRNSGKIADTITHLLALMDECGGLNLDRAMASHVAAEFDPIARRAFEKLSARDMRVLIAGTLGELRDLAAIAAGKSLVANSPAQFCEALGTRRAVFFGPLIFPSIRGPQDLPKRSVALAIAFVDVFSRYGPGACRTVNAVPQRRAERAQGIPWIAIAQLCAAVVGPSERVEEIELRKAVDRQIRRQILVRDPPAQNGFSHFV